MTLRNLTSGFGLEILKEGQQIRFRNERRKFTELVDTIITRFPKAVSARRTLNEPYKSLAFLVVFGQRPVTSLLIFDILLRTEERTLNGKEIGEMLAKKLDISSALTTKGGNYKDRVGDLLCAYAKIGILESVFSDRSDRRGERYRIRKSAFAEVIAFTDCFRNKNGVLNSLKPPKLEDLFKERFNQRIGYVIKSGSEQSQPFNIGKIMKSLLDPKLGVSFESALQIIEEIEPELKTGMDTLDIQSMLYNALRNHDMKAAENYRLSYPEISSITMSTGKTILVNYKFVKALIKKEVKLRLTRNLMDRFASTVYNIITRNPQNYRNETAVREYIDTLIHSECMRIRSDTSFIQDHLDRAVSAVEGYRDSLQSDEIKHARDLLGEFIEQICLVILSEFGYLPFKNPRRNVNLISNLLKQEKVKRELTDALHLDRRKLFQIQRIRFIAQRKDTANRSSLEKIAFEATRLIDLCKSIFQEHIMHVEPKPITLQIPKVVPPKHIATGYEDLDSLMFGGIPENYAVILTSPSCDERDLLIERFLETGVKNNQITFHVTIDGSNAKVFAEKFPSSFYLIICNPEADAIIKTQPNVFKLKGVENLTDINIALNSAFRELDRIPKKARRICIGIISDTLLQHQAVSTRRWLTALIPSLKSRGFTTLAVMNPHMHSPQEVQAILDLFEGEIHIYRKKTAKKGLKRFLRIEKMYHQDYSEDELPLRKERIRAEM